MYDSHRNATAFIYYTIFLHLSTFFLIFLKKFYFFIKNADFPCKNQRWGDTRLHFITPTDCINFKIYNIFYISYNIYIIIFCILQYFLDKIFFIRPLGQAVKTSPFHGGDMGSIPVGVTNICHFSSAGRATDL